MNLCKEFPRFIVLCMAAGGILAHKSSISVFTGVAVGLAVGILPIFLLGAIVGLMLA